MASRNTSIIRHHLQHIKEDNRSVILFFTEIHNRPVVSDEHGRNINCNGGKFKCFATSNKLYINHSSAVVFDAWMNLYKEIPLALKLVHPDIRPEQWWIYYNRESTQRSKKWDLSLYDPVFNWTMTYKLDSDIVYRYSIPIPGRYEDGYNSSVNYLQGRNKTAVAFISNCYIPRLDFIEDLREYIDVDIFGKCGEHCHGTECWSVITNYKFYLAFENSLCKDYITEKTYSNSFSHLIIPVILSGANLSNPVVIPPNSYISVTDFSTVKELAKYLKYVGSNEVLYNEYFKWRDYWNIIDQYTYKNPFCSICEKLYNPGRRKSYGNLNDYFSINDCHPYPTLLDYRHEVQNTPGLT
jgi:alpha-1,3-fucosyltransferase